MCEGAKFGDHLKEKYGIAYSVIKENVKSRQKENIIENDMKMRAREEPGFGERI